MKNYVVYHLHDDRSLLDSTTKFANYVDRAIELGQKAICLTNHGNIYNWVSNKQLCDDKGIKYLHGIEMYLTEKLLFDTVNNKGESVTTKKRDNYHTILIAKNYKGVLELNELVSLSNTKTHTYYKNRISFDEFLAISDNIVKISACLGSPLNKISTNNPYYDKLCKAYDYYEVQAHVNSEEQKTFNKHLYLLSKQYNKPLIAGTDTHNLNRYMEECRNLLLISKQPTRDSLYEDVFNLTYLSYDELVDMFKEQDSLPEDVYLQAIENTNVMADTIKEFTLNKDFKYPVLYDDEEKIIHIKIIKMFEEKINSGIIPLEQVAQFKKNIVEEFEVFKQIKMIGFMLFMSELCGWCHDNNIPIGFGRGSVTGSSIAYILDIIDVNPVQWHTVFSRFANKYRLELGDIDCDFAAEDRGKVYTHIFDSFGKEYSCHILSLMTVANKGCIDLIGNGILNSRGERVYSLEKIKEIKEEFETDNQATREKYKELFYYFDGLSGIYISQSMHPAGIIVSPIPLRTHYGTTIKTDESTGIETEILQIDMEDSHSVNLVKYDILGLSTVDIIKNTCEMAGIPYPRAHEINWNDNKVFDSLGKSKVGLFQFESSFAYDSMKEFGCNNVEDLALITGAIRPSGASYRDNLMKHIINTNPSKLIDNLLSNSYGYLVYQEQTIAFLQQICGLSGGDADNIRRAIGNKDYNKIQKALPSILEGYCKTSLHPRDIAIEEAKQFLQIIEDSSSYSFGYNHALAYSMITYLCAYLRYYYPYEFICAKLNNAQNEEDINMGKDLINDSGYILHKPKFRHSKSTYFFDKSLETIYKGMLSIKHINERCSLELCDIGKTFSGTFLELLQLITKSDNRQLEILIQLGYFEEFGKSKKLLEFHKVYQNFIGKKSFNKEKDYIVSLDVLKIFCQKETTKTYAQFNDIGFLEYQWDSICNEDIPLIKYLEIEHKNCGSLSYINPKLEDVYYVIDFKLYNDINHPYVTLYNLSNGNKIKTDVCNKACYIINPFQEGSLIHVNMFKEKRKKRKDILGKWVDTGIVKQCLEDWFVIKGEM